MIVKFYLGRFGVRLKTGSMIFEGATLFPSGERGTPALMLPISKT